MCDTHMSSEEREAETRLTHFKVGFKNTESGGAQGKGGNCLGGTRIHRGPRF